MQKLSPKQRLDLEIHVGQTRDITTRNRLCAILAYDKGQTIQQIAAILCLSEATICLYINQYHSRGKTENDSKGGSESKLSEEQSKTLEKHLTETTYLYVKHICKYIQETFNITFSRSGMTFWLKARGFTYKKPKRVPGKVNPEQQEIFKTFYSNLKSTLPPGDEIYFGDAVHPEYQSQAVSGWIKKGEEKTIQTTGKQTRLHFAGALNLEKMDLIIQEHSKINKDSMSKFLYYLRTLSKAPTIHLIMDNGTAHKNRQVEKIASELNIKIHYLPPYSPNLNPIERLWKIFRQKKLYNRFYAEWKEFCKVTRNFFKEDIPKMGDELSARINDNFQTIKLNPIKTGKIIF